MVADHWNLPKYLDIWLWLVWDGLKTWKTILEISLSFLRDGLKYPQLTETLSFKDFFKSLDEINY